LGRIGISITKSVNYRGVEQEFTNTYHYVTPGAGVAGDHAALVAEIVAIERDLHSSDVTFRRAKVWSTGLGQQNNEMLHQQSLSGTGNQIVGGSMDRERAFLMQWPAGKDSRGKPVFLRKWFHSCGGANGYDPTSGVLQQTSAIPESGRDAVSNKANGLRIIGPLDEWLLVAQSGREHTGPGRIHKFLEHHQLGDMWR
jgi:hypothetical protein